MNGIDHRRDSKGLDNITQNWGEVDILSKIKRLKKTLIKLAISFGIMSNSIDMKKKIGM